MAEKKKYVFDTSSLSHAFEDFTHSLGSVIRLCIEKGIPPEKCEVPRYIRNRAKSTGDTRRILTECVTQVCLAPTRIVDELSKNPQFRDEIDLLFYGRDRELAQRYAVSARGYMLPKMSEIPVPHSMVLKMREHAVRILGVKDARRVSDQDLSAIALAMMENATLVTADWRMHKIAKELGIDVVYTMGTE
jgi:hypothetical protein